MMAAMATSTKSKEKDYSHRTTVQKLGVRPGERIEVQGDVGPGLRKDVKDASGRGLVKAGPARRGDRRSGLDRGRRESSSPRYRPRVKDAGWLWLVTRKRGHENYLNQMLLVPYRQAPSA